MSRASVQRVQLKSTCQTPVACMGWRALSSRYLRWKPTFRASLQAISTSFWFVIIVSSISLELFGRTKVQFALIFQHFVLESLDRFQTIAPACLRFAFGFSGGFERPDFKIVTFDFRRKDCFASHLSYRSAFSEKVFRFQISQKGNSLQATFQAVRLSPGNPRLESTKVGKSQHVKGEQGCAYLHGRSPV